MSVGPQQPQPHPFNGWHLVVVVGIVVGAWVYLADKPKPDDNGGDVPLPVATDVVEVGRKCQVDEALGRAANYREAARKLRAGSPMDTVDTWLDTFGTETRLKALRPANEALDASTDAAKTFEDLATGVEKAVKP